MRSFLLFLLAALLNGWAVDSIPVVVLNPDQETYELKEYIEVAVDPTNKLTVQQMSDPAFSKNFTFFSDLKEKKIYDATVWIRFRVENPTDQVMHIVFTRADPSRQKGWDLDAEQSDGSFTAVPSESPGRTSFQFVLYFLHIPPHSAQTFYAHQYTEGASWWTHILQRTDVYAMLEMDEYFTLGINYGVPIALLLYSLFTFFIFKDKTYLIYSFFILSMIILFVFKDGLLNRIPNYSVPPRFTHWVRFLMAIIGFLYILFAKNLLHASEYAPRLNKIAKFFLFFSIPFAIISLIKTNSFYYSTVYNDLTASISTLYLVSAIFLSLILSLVVLARGYAVAKYYIAGMFCLFTGLVMGALIEYGLFPHTTFSLLTVNLSVDIDMIFQAIALAVRFDLIRKSEIQAQQEVIRQKELSSDIQRKALLEQQKLTLSYARFFPQRFLEILKKKSVTEVALGDHMEKQITVLFADLHHFTAFLESKEIEKNFALINAYLNRVGPLVRKYEGFIDKYVGDALLALFEASADSALETAIEIIDLLRQVNRSGTVIQMGIGIHYGPLMVGAIGEEERMDETVIGDTVNTASRLENLNSLYGTHILVSEQAISNLRNPSQFRLRFIDELYVKGKQVRIKIFEVYNVDSLDVMERKFRLASDYENAIDLYQKRQFTEALAQFTRCLEILPGDKVIDLYIKRCHRWLKSPLQEPGRPIGTVHEAMEINIEWSVVKR